MAVVPAGSFRMGCVAGDACAAEERPVRTVTIEAPFSLSKYEVTFEDFDRFAEAAGRERPDDQGWGRGRRPVINVSWADAEAYAEWLSAETGRSYRLPSEAEWEYAARAGGDTPYGWSDTIDGEANCDGCGRRSPRRTVLAGTFRANAWGLHDMHGNVWEWVQDCWNGSYEDAPADGTAWTTGNLRTPRAARRVVVQPGVVRAFGVASVRRCGSARQHRGLPRRRRPVGATLVVARLGARTPRLLRRGRGRVLSDALASPRRWVVASCRSEAEPRWSP